MSITFSMGITIYIMGAINKQVLTLMHQAVDVVVKQVANRWVEAVYKAKLLSGEKDLYAKSIS